MRTILMPLAAFALMFAAVPAQALVTYKYVLPVNGIPLGFTWTTPDFVRGDVTAPEAGLDSCVNWPGEICDAQVFRSGVGPGDTDVLEYRRHYVNNPSAINTLYNYFEHGAFTTVGVHHIHQYGLDITLTVTESAAAVPEPASWAMLITGFGLTGAALRRRRMADAAIA